MSVGLNKNIDFAVTLMTNELWTGFNNSFNGRSFRLRRKDTQKVNPEVYQGSNEYKEVLLTDKFDSIVHFDVEPSRDKISSTQYEADVNIIFAVNIGTIYGSSTRATEEAINAARAVIESTSFQINNVVEYPDALSQYDIEPKDEHIFNMQPYYVFAFETTVNYATNNVCEVILPTQYNLTLTADGSGSILPFEGTETKNAGEIVALYADADAGFRLDQWLINNASDTDNPTFVKMTSDIEAIAQFVVSVIKELTIAVSGVGTTDPVPGIYELEEGTSQLIRAIETDSEYLFDFFEKDGVPLVGNPVSVEITGNNLVVAYFVLKWIQDVISTGIVQNDTDWAFNDRGVNDNDLTILNTPVAKFNGVAYISGDFTGYTISSFEGLATPTKTNDSRIDVTADLIYSITITNGTLTLTWYAQEEQGTDIIFADDSGNVLNASLTSGNVADFRSTRSDLAFPAVYAKGCSKNLVCESAGTTTALGLPDGSNLGADKIINGGFTNWSGIFPNETPDSWTKDGTITATNYVTEVADGCKIVSDGNAIGINQFITEVNKLYLLEFDVNDLSGTWAWRLGFAIKYTIQSTGKNKTIINGDGQVIRLFRTSGGQITVNNVSAKEITAIDLTLQANTWSFLTKPVGNSDIYFINSTNDTSGNGYMLRITSTSLTLFRNDAGVLTQLDAVSTAVTDYDIITINELTVSLNGVQQLTSADSTYTTTLLFTADLDVNAEISDLKYNDERFTLEEFVDNTGTTGVKKVIGVGSNLDALGNELQYPPNSYFENNQKVKGIQLTGIETNELSYDEVTALSDPKLTTTENTNDKYITQIQIDQ